VDTPVRELYDWGVQPRSPLSSLAAALAVTLFATPGLAQVESALVEIAEPTEDTPVGVIGGSFLGVRGSRLDFAEEELVPGESWGIGGQALFAGIVSYRALTMRGDLSTHLGTGDLSTPESGFDARLGGGLTIGLIGHLAQSTGLFIRAGIGGDVDDNERYHFSRVDFPTFEAGWQLHLDNFGVELGGRGGVALGTSYDVERHTKRDLDVAGAYGGYVTLSLADLEVPMPGVWLDVAFMRHEADAPLQFGTARLCGGYALHACFDGRLVQATLAPESDAAGENEITTVYLGVSLGFGGAFAIGSVEALNRIEAAHVGSQ
jgi:hypothetical protein